MYKNNISEITVKIDPNVFIEFQPLKPSAKSCTLLAKPFFPKKCFGLNTIFIAIKKVQKCILAHFAFA